MSPTPKIVTIFGGSGFVGRYIARRMARQGWRVRVAVRRPEEAYFVRPYGTIGQVEPILANIRDEASTRAALRGATAAVNCVGTFDKGGRNHFDAVHVDGAGRIARLASEEGVGQFVHISALSADKDSTSAYNRSKAEGEEAVLAAFPDAMILRPSVIFGPEDQFFNRFGRMARFTPVMPIVGGETKFQPVYVDDVAQAAQIGATGQAAGGIYELGGPLVETFNQLIDRTLKITRRWRLKMQMPFFLARINAGILDLLQFLTGGLFHNSILTKDQVEQLKSDVVVSGNAKTFADLGIKPEAMEAILDSYMYAHRPQGQYTELTESAKNLKNS